MIIIILLVKIVFASYTECDPILGEWRRIVITEDKHIVDSCIQNFSDDITLKERLIKHSFFENNFYNYYDEWNNIDGKWYANNQCDSLGIYTKNKNPEIIKFWIHYKLINNNLLLFKSRGRHGTIFELLNRIK